jgi:hypothetical protein
MQKLPWFAACAPVKPSLKNTKEISVSTKSGKEHFAVIMESLSEWFLDFGGPKDIAMLDDPTGDQH